VHLFTVKAIERAMLLKTKAQLRSFLRMCIMDTRLTESFAQTAESLNELNSVMVPKQSTRSTSGQQEALETPRRELCHPLIRSREGKGIIDWHDSCNLLGCCLLQQRPDDTSLPVGYSSTGIFAVKNTIPLPRLRHSAWYWPSVHINSSWKAPSSTSGAIMRH